MADESIGQVSVNIVGDYSGLEKSFSESQQLAQSAGQAISSSFQTAAAGANTLTNAAEMTDEQVQHLFDDGMQLAQAWTKVHGSTVEVAEGMGKLKAEMGSAAASTEGLGDSFKRVRNDSEAFEKAWGEALIENKKRTEDLANATANLENSFVSMVAAVASFAALKQLGEDSLMAYGRVQQLTTSLDLLGAGAKGATKELNDLKILANQLAIPFDVLAQKAQNLASEFGTGGNLNAVIIAAGNASAGSGKSFEGAASALEGIAIQGAVTRGTLKALGLSWEDLAKSAGTSIEDARDKFKKGSQSAAQDVADVIDAINEKYHDAAERQAQNTLGIWTNLKNQATFIFQDIGTQMGDLGPLLSDGLKILASGVVAFIGGIQQVTVIVMGLVRASIDGIVGLGQVALATMKGDYVAAAVAAAGAYAKIKTDSEYTEQSMADHAKKTADTLINIWYGAAAKIKASFVPDDSGGGGSEKALAATRDKVKGFKDLSSALAVLIAMEKDEIAAQQAVVNATAKYNEATHLSLTAVEYLQLQVAKASGDLATFDRLTAKASGSLAVMADAAKMAGQAVSIFERSGEENQTAIKAYEAKTAFDLMAPSIDKADKLLKTMATDATATQKQLLSITPEGKLGTALEAIGIKWDKVTESTDRAKLASAEYVAANVGDFNKAAVAWEVLNSSVSRLARVNLPEAINVQNELIASMERMNAPMLQIIEAQEKELQLEIQLKTERGQSANAQIIALYNMRAGTAALATLNNSLANTYIALGNTVHSAIGSLSGAISQIINGAGSFYKAWHQAMNQFEAQLVSTVIQAIIEFGVAWVKVHLLHMAASKAADAAEIAGIATVSAARATATTAQIAGIAAVATAQTAATATFTSEQIASFVAIKAAATALDVSEVLGYAAVGGAAAAASTAAIPIIGPALALEAGAAMYAGIAGLYGPLATFSEGGMVPEDMLALVHKGEYVLPAEKTAAAVAGGGGGAGIQVHFDFSGAHFSNGLNDTQVKTVFDRAFRMSKLAGALPAGRFPQ